MFHCENMSMFFRLLKTTFALSQLHTQTISHFHIQTLFTMYNQTQQRKRQSWEKYDSVLFGLGVGLVVPFIGLAILMIINETFASSGGAFDGFSDKFTRLLAICLNLIPFSVFNKKRMIPSMRGVFIPTLIYAMIWFFIYSAQIFAGEV